MFGQFSETLVSESFLFGLAVALLSEITRCYHVDITVEIALFIVVVFGTAIAFHAFLRGIKYGYGKIFM
ncbi:hypothetical protein [Nostoc sp. C117]|uniref:hypothetical protein n=1 Tax=Nostoc sp. C117 TaxID=3349875 RepID=UPI00370D4344